MKTKFHMLQAGVLFVFVWAASAGTLDFVRDQLGIDPTNFPFGSPVSSFPGFQRSSATVNSEEWAREMSSTNTNVARGMVRLSFVSNKLESIMFDTYGKAQNDRLVGKFAELLHLRPNEITGSKPYEVREDNRLFSYRGLCSAEENFAALFLLTTTSSERRSEQARLTRLDAAPFFLPRSASPNVVSDALQSASVMMERNSGPATNVSAQVPPGISVQITRNTITPERERDYDYYSFLFKPDGTTNFLPESWRFSVISTDWQQKPHEQNFEAVYDWKRKAPFNLQVSEAKK